MRRSCALAASISSHRPARRAQRTDSTPVLTPFLDAGRRFSSVDQSAMNLLVTGGCGFIGSNFVRRQRQTHPDDRLVVLDALTYAGNLKNLDDLRGDGGMH